MIALGKATAVSIASLVRIVTTKRAAWLCSACKNENIFGRISFRNFGNAIIVNCVTGDVDLKRMFSL